MTGSDAIQATRREWVSLAVLALPCVLYSMDLTVLNLAIPSLTTDLKPTAAQLLWIVDIYGFLAAGALLIMGALGDRIGRRRLLLIGSAAFAVVSFLAAFSKSAEMLIVARGLLGIAGATMAPSTLSLINTMFRHEREKTFAVSVWVSSFSFGGAIGPVVGGMLIAHFWWGAVFLAPIPIMALLLILGPGLLPEHHHDKAGRIDIVSAVLTLATVLPIIFAIKHIAEGGDVKISGLAAAVGLICGGVFVRRQLKLEDPLLDLRLFKLPALSVALTINALDFLVGFGILVVVAQYLQLVLGALAAAGRAVGRSSGSRLRGGVSPDLGPAEGAPARVRAGRRPGVRRCRVGVDGLCDRGAQPDLDHSRKHAVRRGLRAGDHCRRRLRRERRP